MSATTRRADLHALVESVQVVAIDSVRPLERNPRMGDVETIRELLRYHGLYAPIVVREQTGEILKGNHTWHACKAEGYTEIVISRRSVPDDDDAHKLAIGDNRASDLSSWDLHGLAELFKGLPDFDGTGYDPGDVDRLLADYAASVTEPAAPPPPAPADWITRPGDVIRLGRHVLVCGDAREPKAWAKLGKATSGELASLLWTDPPYGVDVVGTADTMAPGVKAGIRAMEAMEGDGLDAGELLELLRASLSYAAGATHDDASFYVCHADSKRGELAAAFDIAGWSHRQTLIWAKDSLVMGRQDYHWRHEAIAYGWKAGAAHRWFGERDKNTIIEGATRAGVEALEHEDLVDLVLKLLDATPGTICRFARPRVADEHPTSKPVELVAGHLHNSSQPGEHVLDPFAGAGSTLLAAEQTDRAAQLLELHPGYCDVIVSRWEDLTGATAMRPSRRRRKENTP